MKNIAKTESGIEVIAPTVHLNGTGKADLLNQYLRIRGALWEAQRTISEGSPHGRDYYVQDGPEEDGEAVRQAAIENRARLLKLHEIEEEITAILINISDQGR